MKETENDTNQQKDISCSWIGRINIVKMSIPSAVIHRYKAIQVKMSKVFFSQK